MTSVANQSIDLLADLVRINSVNPNYAGGVPEATIAGYVEAFFRSRGIEVASLPVLPDRPNVIARIPGCDSSRRVILEAHLDTVSVDGMEISPWDPIVRDGKLYGRGACDTKGGMAAMMSAVASIAAEQIRPACEVVFAATIDEEYSFRGVAAFCQGLTADAAIVAEPTSLQQVIASKGLVRFKVETRGRSAHSAKPHLGLNAIEHMARVIDAIRADSGRLCESPHPLLGPPTCNIGVIRGGVQINLVPASCEIEIDRRLLPQESVHDVLDHYRALVARVANENPDMRVLLHTPMLTDLPLETEPSSTAVQTMTRVLNDLGLDSRAMGVPFCSDASKFGAIGIPSIILGPGSIDQAHAAVEYIECDQVKTAVEIYRRFIVEFK
jgi:acetylornithine deacetylase